MNSIIEEDLKKICNNDLDWEKFKNTTVLITGAYGMLPLYMLYTLFYLNELYPSLSIRVIAMYRDAAKAEKRFKPFFNNPLFSLLCNDVVNKIKSKGKIDYIIHAASPASSQFYGVDPVSVISSNVFGTKNLLELAREKKCKGFLFFSSGEVSGKVDKEIITEKDYGYLDPMDVRSCYGESKRMAENMCKCWNYQHMIPAIIVRPEHTYGPTMDLKNDKRVFSEFVSDIVNNKDIIVKSDGLAVRNFCYISDATDGFFRALLNGVPGESYNVGNNNGKMSIKDLANLLVSIFPEKNLKVIFSARKDNDSYLENKDKIRPILSTAKIEKLGFKASVSVRDGFTRTIKGFSKGENNVI